MTQKPYLLRSPLMAFNCIAAVLCALIAHVVSSAAVFVPHENTMSDVGWRAFAISQFFTPLKMVFCVAFIVLVVNAFFLELMNKKYEGGSKNSQIAALCLTGVFLFGGVFGSALGAYHVYVERPLYFD